MIPHAPESHVRTVLRMHPAMVGHYPLRSGIPTVDISGKGQTGTITLMNPNRGKYDREPGLYGAWDDTHEAWFDSNIATILQAFTMGGWAFCLGKADGSNELWSKRQYYSSAHAEFPFAIYLDAAATSISYMLDSGNDYTPDHRITTAIPGGLKDRWFFYCLTRNGNNNILNINGIPVVVSSWAGTMAAGNKTKYRFGSPNGNGPGQYTASFNGYFGEHFIMNVGIDQTQIAHIYRQTRNRYLTRGAYILDSTPAAGGESAVPVFQSNYSRRRRAA